MRLFKTILSVFILSGCSRPCLTCDVIKNGEVIENYQSCDDEGKDASQKICEEMAKLQNCQCECRQTDKKINE